MTITAAPYCLQTHQLSCIRGGRVLFENLDIKISNGDALHISGDNGSGKTSLLRMLCGLSEPTSGMVSWGGVDIRREREQFCSQLIYLGHSPAIKDDLTGCENLLMSAALSGNQPSDIKHQAFTALALAGLDQFADLPTGKLSQGQKKRLAQARLLLNVHTPLWILDEPFVALDQPAIVQLTATINIHLERGGMLIYSTHQTVALQPQRALHIDLNQASA